MDALYGILYRMDNYERLYEYYKCHRAWIPLPFCQKIHITVCGLSNPNAFDYFMKPDKRKVYTLPSLFIQCEATKRSGSTIRILIRI